jgi:lipopolysaccharide/colanic/teichoic acid biosynthesis glycosyltransferase
MKSFKFLILDVLLVVAGTLFAQALRDNFEIVHANIIGVIPYLLASILSAFAVVLGFRLNRTVWRFSTMRDYLMIAAAAAMIVVTAVLLTFSFNRLEGLARSIPFLQFLTILVMMVGARVYSRIHYSARRGVSKQFTADDGQVLETESTIIVGLNRLTELYLQAAHEFGHGKPRIAGLIGRTGSHTGRLMHRYPVLGETEQLPAIIQQLRLHGVAVTRIVVTLPPNTLSSPTRGLLRDLESTSDIEVNYLTMSLGLETGCGDGTSGAADPENDAKVLQLQVSPAERVALSERSYWPMKRFVDVTGSIILLVLLAPAIVVTALLVAIDIGRPVLFWQQRPGLGGRAFRVYKFRTMRPAFDTDGRALPDNERASRLGSFLRRCRLDELPQLFNILVGEMSFIGPRPLLPVDQPMGASGRLLVRPGLTGWAQVKGGRTLSPADKVALDVWYVRNASLAVDAEIVWRTILMVLGGDREDPNAVRQAWADIAQRAPAARVDSVVTADRSDAQAAGAPVDCRTSMAS